MEKKPITKMKNLIYALLFLVACQPTDPNATAEVVDQEVRKMLTNYHEDMAKYGLRGEFKYLDESEDFFWNPPGYNTTLDYESVKVEVLKNADRFRSVSYEWDTLSVYPLSANLASFSGIVTGAMTDTAGVVYNVRLMESGTVTRRKDGWKLLNGHSSNLTE